MVDDERKIKNRSKTLNRAIAEQIAQSKASTGGNYIKPGKYLFEIGLCLAEKKFGGNMWITELVVLESLKTDPAKDPNGVGTSCSFVTNLDKAAGPGNAKAFCMAAYNVEEEEINVDVLEETAGAAQPLKFMRIRCEAYDKPVRSKPGSVFTATKWEHVAPTDADLKAIAEKKAPKK